jgi:hypothetical protein
VRPDTPHPAKTIALNMPDPNNTLHFMMSKNPLSFSAKNNALTKEKVTAGHAYHQNGLDEIPDLSGEHRGA